MLLSAASRSGHHEVPGEPPQHIPSHFDPKTSSPVPQKKEGPEAPMDKLKRVAKTVYDQGKAVYHRVYHGDVLPPVGSFQLSYAQFIHLLSTRKVKRIMLLAEGRVAVVEIPVENTESHFGTVKYDRRDLRCVVRGRAWIGELDLVTNLCVCVEKKVCK